MPLEDVETRLAAARTRLILDKPFLGALVLRLPMVKAATWCKTTATDAKTFYYNPAYIEALSISQTEFVLAHEALHCALLHFARRQHRAKHRWDVACDHAVNPLLVAEGLKPPPGTLLLDAYTGMTAEEIYPFIADNPDEEPLDQHLYDDQPDDGDSRAGSPPPPKGERPESGEGNGQSPRTEQDETAGGAPQPPPLDTGERDTLAVQWQQRLAGAAQQAMQAGKMGKALARLVDHLLQPQLPWRMLLARYMTAIARDDYSYMRPSRREGAAILPSLRGTQIDLTVVLDISGSITNAELSEFIAEVNAIKGQIQARITLHACDAVLAPGGPWNYEPWEPAQVPAALGGGGGTSFVPVFDWVEQCDRAPDLLVYFTDADGTFPAHEPTCPVLWLVKGKRPVPWGQRVQLN